MVNGQIALTTTSAEMQTNEGLQKRYLGVGTAAELI
jgi:ABC-type branched-subunit amino acid transport system ATPase component